MDFAGKWRYRTADSNAEPAELVAGEFAIVLQEGRPTYVPLSKIGSAPDRAIPPGLLLTRQPLNAYPSIEAILRAGLEKPLNTKPAFMSIRSGKRDTVAGLRAPGGDETEVAYLKLTDGKVQYLKPTDPDSTRPGAGADGKQQGSQQETRELQAAGRMVIHLAGLPLDIEYVEADKKWYLSVGWIQNVGSELRPPALEAQFIPDVAPFISRVPRLTDYRSPYYRHTFPDGTVLAVTNVPPGESSSGGDGMPLNRRILMSAGSVKTINSSDGSVFQYNPRLRAFVHDKGSPLPLTVPGLKKLDESRLEEYRQIASLALIPGSIRIPTFEQLTSEQRLDFGAAVDESMRNDLDRILGISSREATAAHTWSELSQLNVEEQMSIASTVGQTWNPFQEIVTKYLAAKGESAITWGRLSPSEQLAVHSFMEVQYRRAEYARKREQRWVDLFSDLGKRYLDGRQRAKERHAEAIDAAKKRTFGEGDYVMSSNEIVDWEGRILSKISEIQYEVKITWARGKSEHDVSVIPPVKKFKGEDFIAAYEIAKRECKSSRRRKTRRFSTWLVESLFVFATVISNAVET